MLYVCVLFVQSACAANPACKAFAFDGTCGYLKGATEPQVYRELSTLYIMGGSTGTEDQRSTPGKAGGGHTSRAPCRPPFAAAAVGKHRAPCRPPFAAAEVGGHRAPRKPPFKAAAVGAHRAYCRPPFEAAAGEHIAPRRPPLCPSLVL